MKKKIFAIGDIHGCITELKLLLNSLPIDRKTILIFLGDYIDRGENSKAVVDLILKTKKRCQVIALMGNHEAMLLDFLKDPESEEAGRFIYNGGAATLASYLTGASHREYDIPTKHLDFFSSLSLTHQTENYLFVHAGLPNKNIEDIDPETDRNTLIWIREEFIQSSFNWKKIVVHGHTPVARVQMAENRINLDTGCIFDGHLSAIQLPERIIYSIPKQVKTHHTYLKDTVSPTRVAARFPGRVTVVIHRQGQSWPFETLNYSEFGFLIRSLSPVNSPIFGKEEDIVGEIKLPDNNDIWFEGIIIRSEKRAQGVFYAVKIKKLQGRVANF